MTVYSEPNYLGDLLKWEQEKYFSREQVTVLSGESVVMGEMMGKITIGEVSEDHTDNTGDGAMTLDETTPALDGAQVGDYTVECITAEANGGTFRVSDPSGNVLGDVEVGDTFANQIKFEIADGAADFIVGDTFTVSVAAGSGKVVPIDFTAVDGSQDAHGFMTAAVDASAADAEGLAIVRDAVFVADYLTWPDGATDAQKAAALAQLADKGMIERTEV